MRTEHIWMLAAFAFVAVVIAYLIKQRARGVEPEPEIPRCAACENKAATEPVPVPAQSRKNAIVSALVDGDAASQYGQGSRALVAWDTTAAVLCVQCRRVGERIVEQFALRQAGQTAELKAKQSHEAAEFAAQFFERIKEFGRRLPYLDDAPRD